MARSDVIENLHFRFLVKLNEVQSSTDVSSANVQPERSRTVHRFGQPVREALVIDSLPKNHDKTL